MPFEFGDILPGAARECCSCPGISLRTVPYLARLTFGVHSMLLSPYFCPAISQQPACACPCRHVSELRIISLSTIACNTPVS